jgi:TrmH family RNA methyltransferase
VINSVKNERIKRYRRLRKRNLRYKDGKFLIEGIQAVAEALSFPLKPESIVVNERGRLLLEPYSHLVNGRSIPCLLVDDKVMESLAGTVTPQGILAVSGFIDIDLHTLLASSPSPLLIANRVRDPGNLGSMVRIADAAGVGGLIVCRESVDPYNPKTVRSTAGSLFHVPFCVGLGISEVIHEVRRAGYTVFAAEAHEGMDLWDVEWPERLALVVGNEAWGMPQEEGSLVDVAVNVPMAGKAESLNVASATAVILFELERQRRLKGADKGI